MAKKETEPKEDFRSLFTDDIVESEKKDQENIKKDTEKKKEPEPEKKSEEKEIVSGIGDYLKEFDIDEDAIELGDEKKPWKDLSETQKSNVLKTLKDRSSNPANYLSKEEMDMILINRETGMGLNDIIEKERNDVAKDISFMQETDAGKIEALSNDDMYIAYLKDKNTDISDEDITKELKVARELSDYEDTVRNIKDSYIHKEAINFQKKEKEFEDKNNRDLEEERKKIVQATEGIDSIAGWRVTDEDKNDVYNKMLEYDNEKGMNRFEEEYLSTPEAYFKTVWSAINSEKNFADMNTYYKGQLDKLKDENKKLKAGMSIDEIEKEKKKEEPKNADVEKGSIEEGFLDLGE